jgi:hypothetical protein
MAGFVSDPTQVRSDPYWERARPHRMTLSWLSEKLMGSDQLSHLVATADASLRLVVLNTC